MEDSRLPPPGVLPQRLICPRSQRSCPASNRSTGSGFTRLRERPQPIVGKLNAETAKALKGAGDTRAAGARRHRAHRQHRCRSSRTYLRSDVERTAKLIKAANIKIDRRGPLADAHIPAAIDVQDGRIPCPSSTATKNPISITKSMTTPIRGLTHHTFSCSTASGDRRSSGIAARLTWRASSDHPPGLARIRAFGTECRSAGPVYDRSMYPRISTRSSMRSAPSRSIIAANRWEASSACLSRPNARGACAP